MTIQLNNVLGDIRAESDGAMLKAAFVETPEYKGVVETRDFNFIVGRRGTGKSALKFAALDALKNEKNNTWVLDIENDGNAMLSMQAALARISKDYRELTYITSIITRTALLFQIIVLLHAYYKKDRCEHAEDIDEIHSKHIKIIQMDFFLRCSALLHSVKESDPKTIPAWIASEYEVKRLEAVVLETLDDLGKQVVFFFDNLDEGWIPQPLETSIIGGLAHTASNFKDRGRIVHLYIFSRDNMFRALGALDTDFTRNIEGSTIRLKWDDNSLFHLVCERIRIGFNVDIENHTKIWNRVAKNELSGRDGFNKCTNKTLYRPRDIISLLNKSFLIAAKDNRKEIILRDVEVSSQEISELRLNDLENEYNNVFPSLSVLIRSFCGAKTPIKYDSFIEYLSEFIESVPANDKNAVRDFSILNTPDSCFSALYSIGFVGVDSKSTNKISFCHDGALTSAFSSLDSDAMVWIHPCYWAALSIDSVDTCDIITSIYDDYNDSEYTSEIIDLRMKRIGTVITDIGNIPLGREGAKQFEEWVLRAVKILFSEEIENPQLHPNGTAVSRRDIVGTVSANKGFWSRVQNDYKTRQIVFEIKNYEKIDIDDVRQLSNYLTGQYGNFGIIIPRRDKDGLPSVEQGWVREQWACNKKMIFIIRHSLLAKCISKQRSSTRFDYTSKALSKLLDTFERSYVSIRHR